MKILFIDSVCLSPYDPHTLATQALGGTEATVIRIAEALAQKDNKVSVAQHNRIDHGTFQAQYTGFNRHFKEYDPTHVIVLRAPLILHQVRKLFPKAKLYLWCHDIFDDARWNQGFQAIVNTQTIPIVVSQWHQNNLNGCMRSINFQGIIPSHRIYNPIDDNLMPNETIRDHHKLLFFSSPQKGLAHTLKVFERFQDFSELKDMKLYVANPGYSANYNVESNSNVVQLGVLPHQVVIDHVRSSFAVLHLNAVYPETMGIAHAEANAVGTPFLNSRLGATPECADHPDELIDVIDENAVIKRVLQWKKFGAPKVQGNPNFRLAKIADEWLGLFNS